MLRFFRFRMPILAIFTGLALIIAACGTRVTELRPTFEPTTTFDFTARRIAQGQSGTEVAVVRPTNTSIPPTATPFPPTITPTQEPTDIATEEATEESTSDNASGLPGDPEEGRFLFEQVIGSTGQQCKTCHNPDEPIPGLGPYLYGIANVAGSRVEGLSAEEYLRQSIVDPRAFQAPPQGDLAEWPDDLMPDDWAVYLDEDGVNDILAFLLTLDQTE